MSTDLQRQAWRRMFLLRTCPPLRVLKQGGDLANRHLRSCAMCRLTMKNIPLYAEAGKMLLSKLTRKTEEVSAPKPGDIRKITPKSSSDTWFDANGRYHNPPKILVLSEADDMNQVRVAQIFEEKDLCGEGDTTVGENLFAESWNIYSVPASLLANRTYRTVSAASVQNVLDDAKKTLPSLDEDSTLFHFRNLELETGVFFRMKANLDNREESLPSRRIVFHKDLYSLLKDENWKANIEELPLAAADADQTDPRAETIRLPVLVAEETQNEGLYTQTLPALVSLYPKEKSTVCSVSLRVPRRYPHARAILSYHSDSPEDIKIVWQDDNALSILAELPCNIEMVSNVHLIVCLSERKGDDKA